MRERFIDFTIRVGPQGFRDRIVELLFTMTIGGFMATWLLLVATIGAMVFRVVFVPLGPADAANVFNVFLHGGWIGGLLSLPVGIPVALFWGISIEKTLCDMFYYPAFFGRYDPKEIPCVAKTSTSPKTPPVTSCACSSPRSTRPECG